MLQVAFSSTQGGPNLLLPMRCRCCAKLPRYVSAGCLLLVDYSLCKAGLKLPKNYTLYKVFASAVLRTCITWAGGGRRVIRCELSLDSGETWRRAEIERSETPTPHNKTWCWVFWSVPVSAVELLRAPELRIRAVDSSQNMMPEKCALFKSCCC